MGFLTERAGDVGFARERLLCWMSPVVAVLPAGVTDGQRLKLRPSISSYKMARFLSGWITARLIQVGQKIRYLLTGTG